MNALNPLNSKPISACQICNSCDISSVINLGYVPPVNSMESLNSVLDVQMRFPLELLKCNNCSLVQIGYEVDPRILFPHSYPYLSGTTRILRDNFKDLADKSSELFNLSSSDFVVDVGANDGTLLAPFVDLGLKVLGVEPSQAALVAIKRGIPMIKDYFTLGVAASIIEKHGYANVVTAANVFAHIKNVHEVLEAILKMLSPDGIFISESHYLLDLIETLQYDTIYHEHLRYYSVQSLSYLFSQHGMEIIHVERIPTHGGSIRVYASRTGVHLVNESVESIKMLESKVINQLNIHQFRSKVIQSKLDLMKLLSDLKADGKKIYGIGAPSRASTLINYTGLDNGIIDAVMEVSSSHKLNKYIPGTRIPVLCEDRLYTDNVDYALLFSWHIAEELAQNLIKKGFKGDFIVPLPSPKIFSFSPVY